MVRFNSLDCATTSRHPRQKICKSVKFRLIIPAHVVSYLVRRGLDDYHFYPFLIGAAQLCGHDSLRPSSIGDKSLLEEHYEDCESPPALAFGMGGCDAFSTQLTHTFAERIGQIYISRGFDLSGRSRLDHSLSILLFSMTYPPLCQAGRRSPAE